MLCAVGEGGGPFANCVGGSVNLLFVLSVVWNGRKLTDGPFVGATDVVDL
jgi:hypothetical protein